MTQTTLHLLCGLPGTGKTTFARKLEGERKAVRFTHDEWMHRLYGDNLPADQFQVYHERVSTLIWDYTERLIAFGVDVILDFGFWKKKARQEAVDRAKILGVTPILYKFTCPQAEANRRVLERNKTLPKDSLVIDEHALKVFARMFEPIEDHEECVEVTAVDK
jgi:predicted kinase